MNASARRRFLVLGPTGQVGSALLTSLAPLGSVVAGGRGGGVGVHADLADPDTLRAAVETVAPHVVVNAAAYTAVDRAEAEPERAHALNAVAPGVLAEACAKRGALLVHYSTDYVFDGTGTRPYREDDPPAPLNAYGRSKWEGERAIAATGVAHLILRTSWVYARRGANFLVTMERLFRERPEVRVVDDQRGSPTGAPALAAATAQVLSRLALSGGSGGGLDPRAVSGTYHTTCSGETTWYGFARAIHAHLGATVPLLPIPTSAYPTPARRPAYSVLDNSKLARVFAVTLPAWESALTACWAG